MENIYSVIITAITVLSGTGAWRYYEKRAAKREESENFMRNDCRTRIAKLEALLQKSSEEKEIMREQILKLVEEVSTLRVEIKYLMENGKNKGL